MARPKSATRILVEGGSEEADQIALFDWLRYLEPEFPDLHRVYQVPNGGKRSITVAVKMKRAGQKAGIWDVSCDTARKGYKGFRFELKYGRNTLTAEQKEWQAYYEAQGYLTGVSYSWVD